MLDQIIGFLKSHGSEIGMALGIIFAVAKGVSNEKAVPVVVQIQKAIDGLALIVSKVGDILHAVSDLLANLIKSDGILGKK